VLLDLIKGEAPDAEYFAGPRASFIKHQNVLWMALLCVGAFLSVRLLGVSFVPAVAAAVLAQLVFFVYPGMRSIGLDSLFSEIPATALLVFGSYLVTLAFMSRRLAAAAWAGVCFGLLALTKSAMLYVFFGAVVCIVAVGALFARDRWQQGLAALTLMLVCCGLVVAPWMYRNYSLFDRFQISERGGMALLTRALNNEMTSEEYQGAFYAWAPKPLRPWVGSALGFGPQDLKLGGRLQRLADVLGDDDRAAQMGRPDLAITFYMRGRAERTRAIIDSARANHPHPDGAADQELAQRGLRLISGNLLRHLEVTIPILWRGAVVTLPILILSLGYALLRRRADLVVYLLPSLGCVLFYALLTPFEVRYGTVVLSIAIVLLFALAAGWRNRSSVPLEKPLQSTQSVG